MMDKAKKYNVDDKKEADTLAPLSSNNVRLGGLGDPKGPVGRLPKIRMSLMANQLPKIGGPQSDKRASTMLQSKSNKVRQSIALFSRESVMIKPNNLIQKKNNARASMLGGFGGLGALASGKGFGMDALNEAEEDEDGESDEEPVEQQNASSIKRQQTTRTSVFNRISQGRKGILEKQSPIIKYAMESAFAYYDFWEYYTAMTFFYLLAMFMVFNPFSEEICGKWPCFPGEAKDIPPVRAVFLLIAKWSAAATYVLFAELVFIYSRISLGHIQLTPLHMYVPYMMGSYHDAHKFRGWCFVFCGWLHVASHFVRVAMDANMPVELWWSGGFLCLALLCIMVLAMRNNNLCCLPNCIVGKRRWMMAFFRNRFKWEYMRIAHLIGVFGRNLAIGRDL